MKKLDIKFFLILLCSLLLCVFSSKALAQTVENSTGYKMIPIEQWQILKQHQHQLELNLEELKLQTENLKKHSKELKQSLTEAEQLVTQSKQALLNSNESLMKVESLLEETRASLTKLTQQIDVEREKNRQIQDKLRVQRTIAWIVAGLIFISK